MTWWREPRRDGAGWTWSLGWPLAWLWEHARGLVRGSRDRWRPGPRIGDDEEFTEAHEVRAFLDAETERERRSKP